MYVCMYMNFTSHNQIGDEREVSLCRRTLVNKIKSLMDTCHYIVIKTYRTHNTKSEPVMLTTDFE